MRQTDTVNGQNATIKEIEHEIRSREATRDRLLTQLGGWWYRHGWAAAHVGAHELSSSPEDTIMDIDRMRDDVSDQLLAALSRNRSDHDNLTEIIEKVAQQHLWEHTTPILPQAMDMDAECLDADSMTRKYQSPEIDDETIHRRQAADHLQEVVRQENRLLTQLGGSEHSSDWALIRVKKEYLPERLQDRATPADLANLARKVAAHLARFMETNLQIMGQSRAAMIVDAKERHQSRKKNTSLKIEHPKTTTREHATSKEKR